MTTTPAPTVVRRVLAAAALLAATACTAQDDAEPEAEGAASSSTSSAAPSPEPTATPTETETEAAPVPVPTDGPADFSRWLDTAPEGGDLQVGGVREQTGSYTSYDASYRSEGLLVTGVLNVPSGEGPFPAVVLAHGYIDPAVYVSGQGMTRERGVLASRGYVAFHVDYRNHAGSDDDPALAETQRFGYAVDVLNAVTALRETTAVAVDDARVSIFGRSMGGGAVLQALAIAPGHADAAVVYAGVSSDAADNFRQYSGEGSGYWEEVASTIGTPDDNPQYYADASVRPHLGRVTEPVLMIHGNVDDTCPPEWAEATRDALVAGGAEVSLQWFDDGHAFGPEFDASMDAVTGFLDAQV